MVNRSVLTINTGSSSLKASLFLVGGARHNFNYRYTAHNFEEDCQLAFTQLFNDIGNFKPDIIAHRFVHGGDITAAACLLNVMELERLHSIVHLAPLHLPISLLGVDLCKAHFNKSNGEVKQAACFDTAFHLTMSPFAHRLPIPAKENMHRYGFHGLSYSYLASHLPSLIGSAAYGRVVMAHLGSGASLCLLQNLQSMDTTMGYTPAGGICMATRSGDIDPGVMLELARRHDVDILSDITNNQMGLFALSDGESGEMDKLLKSTAISAKFAVDYFCREVTAAIGSLAAKAGGIDALVFSGGIGEHAAEVRAKICVPLAFIGIKLDEAANLQQIEKLHQPDSLPILRIETDEEIVMHGLVKSLVC